MTRQPGRRALARRRRVAATALLTLPLSACFGEGGSQGGDAVSVSASYQWPAQAPRCTGTAVWVYTPLTLSGKQGRDAQIVERVPFDVTASASGHCTVGSGQIGLKRGTWRVAVDLADTSCDVELTRPQTSVRFTRGTGGCVRWP
jgi:hypothetical protein